MAGKLSLGQKGLNALERGYSQITRWLTNTPEGVAIAAKRLGLEAAQVTPGAIIQAAKENPLTAALLMYEVGEVAAPALASLMEEAPEIADVVQRLKQKNDVVTYDTDLSNIGKFEDELECIRAASAFIGGKERLMTLRRALMIDDSVYLLDAQLQSLGYRR